MKMFTQRERGTDRNSSTASSIIIHVFCLGSISNEEIFSSLVSHTYYYNNHDELYSVHLVLHNPLSNEGTTQLGLL